jgi:hypothetical protein
VFRQRFPGFVIAVDALAFLGFGIAFLLRPEALLAAVDMTLASPVGAVEARAMYGGLEIAVGLFFLAHFKGWVPARVALALGFLTLGFLGIFRLVGTLLLPQGHAVLFILVGMELLGALSNLAAWRMVPKTKPSP